MGALSLTLVLSMHEGPYVRAQVRYHKYTQPVFYIKARLQS